MMNKWITIFFALTSLGFGYSQNEISDLQVESPVLQKALDQYLKLDVPTLTAGELATLEDVLILDARESEEYEVSHIPGALHLGYDHPDQDLIQSLDRDEKIVVYCTIGYRSENMVRQLRDAGFTSVMNLYGSIYAWAEEGAPLEDVNGVHTTKIHTYNRKWSKYLENKNYKKVW